MHTCMRACALNVYTCTIATACMQKSEDKLRPWSLFPLFEAGLPASFWKVYLNFPSHNESTGITATWFTVSSFM